MDGLAPRAAWRFDRFVFDPSNGGLFGLTDLGTREPLHIGGRALDVLAILVTRSGAVVPKQTIMDAAWPGLSVEAKNLAVQISNLRRVLDEGRSGQSCIQTVAGRGYRFLPDVTTQLEASELKGSSTGSSVEVDSRAADPWPRLSLVVLPFKSLGDKSPVGDSAHYLAAAITEDLTTSLSRLEGSFVISCETAFTYRNKIASSKEIGRDLGVTYLLGGSIQRIGEQIRVGAHLIEAADDRTLWAARFDVHTNELFALQDEITGQLANALGVELVAAEAGRPRERPDALDCVLRGRAILFRPWTSGIFREASEHFETALMLDPTSAAAKAHLAYTLVTRMLNGVAGQEASDICRAETLIDQVFAASQPNAFMHIVKALVLRAGGRYEEGVAEYEAALDLNPNLSNALAGLAWCKLHAGAIEQVIPLIERAIRLSPRDPRIGSRYYIIGTTHLLLLNMVEAIAWLEKARSAGPTEPFVRARLASAYALNGELDRARVELSEAQKLDGNDLFTSIARLKSFPGAWQGALALRPLYEDTIFAGLRIAGMPDG